MKVFVLERTGHLPFPLQQVFSFFEDPENLARITPETLGFQILTPAPIVMKVGAVIDYTIRLGLIPIRWRTLITSYEPPFRFVDEQLKGPYSFWHHEHTFAAVGEGTEMRDVVHYALPGGVIGVIAHRFFIRRRLQAIFDYREKVISRLIAGQNRAVMV